MIREMGCSEAQLLISKRLDGTCDEAELAALSRHAAGCAACRQFAQDMATLSRALDRLPGVPLAEGFVPAVMAALPLRVPRKIPLVLRLAQFAAGVAAFAGGLMLSSSIESTADAADVSQIASREPNSRPIDLGEMLRPEALDGDLILAMTGPEDQAWQR